MRLAPLGLLLVLTVALASCGGDASSTPPTATRTPAPSSTAPSAATSTTTSAISNRISDISTLTFVDPEHGWAIGECSDYEAGTKCTVLTTSDGGKTWRSQYRSIGRLQTLQFLDAQHGFAMATGNDLSIIATTDGGNTWKRRDLARNLALTAIDFVTPQLGFALGSGVILQTMDGGQTWVFDYGSSVCSFSTISFATPDAGMAAGNGQDGPCLYQTADGGDTWSESFQGVTSAPVAQAFREFLNPNGSSVVPLPELLTPKKAAPAAMSISPARLTLG